MEIEIKLDKFDTRDFLLRQKDVAETAFMSVACQYHCIWLPFMGTDDVKELNLIESINENNPIKHCIIHTKDPLIALYEAISLNFPKFEEMLLNLKLQTGVKIEIAKLKQQKRVFEKAFFDYNDDILRVVDIGRCSCIAIGLQDVIIVTQWIIKNCNVVRMKNRFSDHRQKIIARGGYRDLLFNIEIEGCIFEIQVHFEPLYVLKEQSHEILDFARAAIEPIIYKLRLLDQRETKDKLIKDIDAKNLELTSWKYENQHLRNELEMLKKEVFLLRSNIFETIFHQRTFDNFEIYGVEVPPDQTFSEFVKTTGLYRGMGVLYTRGRINGRGLHRIDNIMAPEFLRFSKHGENIKLSENEITTLLIGTFVIREFYFINGQEKSWNFHDNYQFKKGLFSFGNEMTVPYVMSFELLRRDEKKKIITNADGSEKTEIFDCEIYNNSVFFTHDQPLA